MYQADDRRHHHPQYVPLSVGRSKYGALHGGRRARPARPVPVGAYATGRAPTTIAARLWSMNRRSSSRSRPVISALAMMARNVASVE